VKTNSLEIRLVVNVKSYAGVLFHSGDVQIDLANGEAQAFDPCETGARTRIETHGLFVSVFDTGRDAIDQHPSFFGAAVSIGDQLSHVELLLLRPRRTDPNTHEK
jgi:hypothetical protein